MPADIETSDRYKGAYLNRFLSSAFTPGVRLQDRDPGGGAGGDPGSDGPHLTCEGSVQIGDETIVCSGTHGQQDIASAFANSCNVAFAQIAVELGEEALAEHTERAEADGQPIPSTACPPRRAPSALTASPTASWAGPVWAMYQDLVNPASLMLYMGAIANGGRAAEPYLIEKTVAPWGCRPCPISPPTPDGSSKLTRRRPWRT